MSAAPQTSASTEVPVDPAGWLPPITFGGIGIWAVFLTLIVALVRIWPAIKKLQNESDASLRADLMKRVTELESRLQSEQTYWEERVRAEQKECDEKVRGLEGTVRDLTSRLEGVTRQFIQYQLAVGHAVSPIQRTPEMDEALSNLERVISGHPAKEKGS